MKTYSKLEEIKIGQSNESVINGCLVLEGGAFRGIYSEGVLDVLLENDINMQCTIGTSAGALNGVNYVAGQYGRSARASLGHRHDKRFVGTTAFMNNQGIIGFNFLFEGMNEEIPFDSERFYREERRLVVTATICKNGRTEYFEKGKCDDIFQAVRASASMPYVSRPVIVENRPCLDGGCSCKIPFRWAIDEGYEKIVVVRTREEGYRKPENEKHLALKYYHMYDEFSKVLDRSEEDYNKQCEDIEALEAAGRIFVIYPSQPVKVTRIESDMEKLGELYELGRNDMIAQLDALKAYLNI